MANERMILSTSDDAARRATVEGWVDSTGRFFGENERSARWSGATHVPCRDCGEPVIKSYILCPACRVKTDAAKFAAMDRKAWDLTTPLFSRALDRYLMDADDLQDLLDDGHSLESLRLVICEPVYAREVDDDYWCDDLPEDMTLDDVNGDIADALEALNKVIREARKAERPLSWTPGKYAAVVELPLFAVRDAK